MNLIDALRGITPNRVALYLTALADVLAVVLVLVADLGLVEVGTVVAALAAANAKALSFVKGWQQYEQAVYENRILDDRISV